MPTFTYNNASSNTRADLDGEGGTKEAYGESFTGLAGSLDDMDLRMHRNGTVTDNHYVEIVTSLGGTPVATSDNVDVSAVTTSIGGEWVNFNFSSPPTLSASTTYYWQVKRSVRDTANYMWVYANPFDADPDVNPDGTAWREDNDVWSDITGTYQDFFFRLTGADLAEVEPPPEAILAVLYDVAFATNASAAQLDFVGQLNAIASSNNLGAVGALRAAGATGTTVVGCLNELAGTSGLELEAAARAWLATV